MGELLAKLVVLRQCERLFDWTGRLVAVAGKEECAPEPLLKIRYDLWRGGGSLELTPAPADNRVIGLLPDRA